MAFDNDRDPVARDETHDLISSEKVDGTAVYNRQGERLGTISNFMVGKRDGRVRYAVLSFGGLFGMGENYHPVPWEVLTYDTDQGGYVIDLDKEILKSSPSYKKGDEPSYDREYGERVYGHYGVSY
jgi:sporulation protein YlmC with PRC-barrel domain